MAANWEFNAGTYTGVQRWQAYDAASSAALEAAFLSGAAHYTLTSAWGVFQMDLVNMMQRNERGARQIRRVDLPTPPPLPVAQAVAVRPSSAPESSGSPAPSPAASPALSGAAAPVHVWQVDLSTYGDGNGRDAVWTEYDQSTSDLIEARWLSGATDRQFRVTSAGRTFDIDLIAMKQIAVGRYAQRSIRRQRIAVATASPVPLGVGAGAASAAAATSGGGGGGAASASSAMLPTPPVPPAARSGTSLAPGAIVKWRERNTFGYEIARTGEVTGIQANGDVLVLVDYPAATKAVPPRLLTVVPPPPLIDPALIPAWATIGPSVTGGAASSASLRAVPASCEVQMQQRKYSAFTGRYHMETTAKTFRLTDCIPCHTRDAPPAVGETVSALWSDAEKAIFTGTVLAVERDTGMVKIRYDDGDTNTVKSNYVLKDYRTMTPSGGASAGASAAAASSAPAVVAVAVAAPAAAAVAMAAPGDGPATSGGPATGDEDEEDEEAAAWAAAEAVAAAVSSSVSSPAAAAAASASPSSAAVAGPAPLEFGDKVMLRPSTITLKGRKQIWRDATVVAVHPPPPLPSGVDDELNRIVKVWKGDITHLGVDAIQNAANAGLWSGGGIDGAIHKAAGPDLKKACWAFPFLPGSYADRCATGDTRVTLGFRLHATHVLHSVGPIGVKPAVLASTYTTALDGAKAIGARSVALCCISTGIFGYPIEQATPVALSTVRQWLERNRGALDTVVFCVFNPQDVPVYTKWMPVFFPLGSGGGGGGGGGDAGSASGDGSGDSGGGGGGGGAMDMSQPDGDGASAMDMSQPEEDAAGPESGGGGGGPEEEALMQLEV